MRRAILIGALLGVVCFGCFAAWRSLRTPQPPRPQPQLADRGMVKSDLLVYARAERAFYGSSGRYASMDELRAKGLLSLPPDTRWPYRYLISVPAPDAFVVVALPQSPEGGRAKALSIDEEMNMREIEPHPRAPYHRRHRLLSHTSVV